MIRHFWVSILAFWLVALSSAMTDAQQGDYDSLRTLDRLHSGQLRKDLAISGAQSCAAASCHGGPRPGVSSPSLGRGGEYQLWIESDPHARALATLCSPKSQEMMSLLGILRKGEIVDRKAYDNCLACHNSTSHFGEANHAETGSTSNLREGVGCSSCHGPDERWRNTHYRRDWSPEMASTDGFVQLKNLFVRARACASCHVGDIDRDMNHDIIAAGHPPLRYEFATYHARLPKHWRDAGATNRSEYESTLWLAGQVAAADANLALLQARSSKSHTVSQWPEFAHYECSSCHHSLGLRRDPAQTTGGIPRYSPWNEIGLRWLLMRRMEEGSANGNDFALMSNLENIKSSMKMQSPKASEVKQLASIGRVALADWFDTLGPEPYLHASNLGQVVATAAGKQETFQTWESAVQFYLAALAGRHAWPSGTNGIVRNNATELRNNLRYSRGFDTSIYGKQIEIDRPLASSNQARELGVGLASELGTVSPEPAPDDSQKLKKLREQLRQTIEELEAKWQDDPESE